jgi:glycosyltransferase involved in cell wall biosynthesis
MKFRACCLRNDRYIDAIAKYTKAVSVLPYRWWSAARPADEEAVSRFAGFFADQGVDLVHVNTVTLLDPLIAARRAGIPSVVHAREILSEDHDLVSQLGAGILDAFATIERIKDSADFVIANSDTTHRFYEKAERSFRLYNMVDTDRLDLPNDRAGGPLKVGIISSNVVKKGVAEFVSLAKLSSARTDIEFVVIGPLTPYVDSFRRELAGDQAVRLSFRGYYAEPAEALSQVNVVLSLSTMAESFGRTIAEAMAARRPVIAYDFGAASELVRHRKEGFLLPYRNYADALPLLEELADRPQLMVEMGERGRRRAVELFSRKVFAGELDRIYRQIFRTWQARD